MKVAIVHEPWTSGAFRCADDVAKGLAGEFNIRWFPQLEEAAAEQFLGRLEEFRPDVVHLHCFYGWLPYKTLLDVARRYRTLFTVHDPRPIGGMEVECWDCESNSTCRKCPLVKSRVHLTPWRSKYYNRRRVQLQVHRQLPDGFSLIAPSRWMKSRLERSELGRFPVHYVPYGIGIKDPLPAASVRRELGFDPSEKLILFLAHHEGPSYRISVRKGLEFAADSFIEKIAPSEPGARLLVAGEKVVPNHRQVVPLGFLKHEEVLRYCSAADVFVCPTKADNLPYTVLEALAAGTPVVASDVGGIPEMVVSGKNGYVVRVGDVEALGDRVVELLGDDRKREAFSESARQIIASDYSMELFLQRHRSLYLGSG